MLPLSILTVFLVWLAWLHSATAQRHANIYIKIFQIRGPQSRGVQDFSLFIVPFIPQNFCTRIISEGEEITMTFEGLKKSHSWAGSKLQVHLWCATVHHRFNSNTAGMKSLWCRVTETKINSSPATEHLLNTNLTCHSSPLGSSKFHIFIFSFCKNTP